VYICVCIHSYPCIRTQAMKEGDCKSVVFSSSATVYGNPDKLPLTVSNLQIGICDFHIAYVKIMTVSMTMTMTVTVIVTITVTINVIVTMIVTVTVTVPMTVRLPVRYLMMAAGRLALSTSVSIRIGMCRQETHMNTREQAIKSKPQLFLGFL
jgi:hypothetical protein